MITCSAWAGKRYAVLGLARSGAATVASLLASGASVVAWDADEERRPLLPLPLGEGAGERGSKDTLAGRVPDPVITPPSVPSLPLSPTLSPKGRGSLEVIDLDTLDLSTFDALVLSPGVPLNTHPLAARARAEGVPIIGDIELFAQARGELPPHKVVGITGTNGKSTTTALVHHILAGAGVPSLMGGNIGLPILAQEPLSEGGVYVLELSSYQLDLTRTLDCDVAVLLNITPDHLDRYDGFEAYAASKARLFEMQSAARNAIADLLSARDHNVIAPGLVGSLIEDAFDDSPFSPGEQHSWPALQGPHNLQNAMAAVEVCDVLGVAADTIAIRRGLETFPGLPHRMQRVGGRGGVAYVNDSKATNPDSAAPALAAFERVHWILGGRAKGDDLDACRPHFPHVARAYTIGEAGPVFASVLRAQAVPVEEPGTLARAVASAAARAEPGDTVLLSPAAASFDQFRDFEARGDAFRSLVEALA